MLRSVLKNKLAAVLVVLILILSPAPAAAQENQETVDLVTQKYYNVIYRTVSYRSGLGHEWSDWIARAIIAYSQKWGVNPLLITAKYAIESNFRMDAYSGAGAIGIAQLMPATAVAVGVDPYDPAGNIEGGIIYFRNQLDAFRNAGPWAATYAVAAYNAGPGAIREYGGVPPYPETIKHLYLVGELLNQLEAQFQG